MRQTFLLAFFLFIAGTLLAQPPGGPGNGMGPGGPGKNARKKLEELEKLKLIETLNMNEDATVRFFARRNDHRKKMRDLNERIDSVFDAAEEALKNGKQIAYKKFAEDALKLEAQVIKERQNFLSSLNDILTDEQVAKLILFERSFRKDVQELMLKRGARKFNKPDDDE